MDLGWPRDGQRLTRPVRLRRVGRGGAARKPAALPDSGGRRVVECEAVARCSHHPNLRRCSMGDKSPKANERKKKQEATSKGQKKSAAYDKAHPAAAVPGNKKGK